MAVPDFQGMDEAVRKAMQSVYESGFVDGQLDGYEKGIRAAQDKLAELSEQPHILHTPTLALDAPVAELDLTVRSYNCLIREHINTIEELLNCTDETLLGIRNMGSTGIKHIDERLAAHGYKRKSR